MGIGAQDSRGVQHNSRPLTDTRAQQTRHLRTLGAPEPQRAGLAPDALIMCMCSKPSHTRPTPMVTNSSPPISYSQYCQPQPPTVCGCLIHLWHKPQGRCRPFLTYTTLTHLRRQAQLLQQQHPVLTHTAFTHTTLTHLRHQTQLLQRRRPVWRA